MIAAEPVDQESDHTSGAAVVLGRHAQARDRLQKIIRLDVVADLTGGHCGLKKRPKGGSNALLEIGAQGFEGRVSRVQGRGEPAFGGNKGGVSLQPFRQCLAGRVLGGEERGGLRAGIDFVTKDGCDQVRTLRKVPVNGADADASLLCNLAHRSVYSRGREYRLGRLEQRIKVALRVGAHAAICAAFRLDTITWVFWSDAHHTLT
jgi:hypothetical protein